MSIRAILVRASWRSIPLAIVFLCFMSPVDNLYALNSDALVWRYQPTFSIKTSFEVLSQHQWGDNQEGDLLSERLNLGVGGFIIDPRIASFRWMSSFMMTDATEEVYDGDDWSVDSTFGVSLFNKINRQKGITFMRYVPSPLLFEISNVWGKKYDRTSFSSQMYYSIPGHIRFFGRGGWVYYDDGTVKVEKENNRFREKFNEDDMNWNRNGDGNWNRNGNGNWNRNGNGNWSENRDVLNADWNSEWQGDTSSQIPFGFRVPDMSLDFKKASWTDKEEGDTEESTELNFRAESRGKGKDAIGESEKYIFTFEYDDSNGDSTNKYDFISQNTFKHTEANTHIYRYEKEGAYWNYYTIRLRYRDRLDKTKANYNAIVALSYQDGSYGQEYGYSLGLGGGRLFTREDKLTPELKSFTQFNLTLDGSKTMSQSDSEEEGGDATSDSSETTYSLSATEILTSTQLSHFPVTLTTLASYTDAGIPYSIRLAAATRGFRQWTFRTNHSYSSLVGTDSSDSGSTSLSSDASVVYIISPRMSVDLRVEYYYTSMTYDGYDVNYAGMNYVEYFRWLLGHKINYRENLRVSVSEDETSYDLENTLDARVLRRSTVSLKSVHNWTQGEEGVSETYTVGYGWRYARLSFSSTYEVNIDKYGDVEHELTMKAKRDFGAIGSKVFNF